MLVSGQRRHRLAYGHIQVNSVCDSGALQAPGRRTINVDVDGACNVVGDIQDGGGQGYFDCVMNEGAPEVPDPLAGLPVAGRSRRCPRRWCSVSRHAIDIPSGCPGSATPATLDDPATCQFPSSYAGTTWRLYPGSIPAGIKLQGGTFYFEPGIYYIAGGGLDITGNGTSTISVGPAARPSDSGVLFYNTGTRHLAGRADQAERGRQRRSSCGRSKLGHASTTASSSSRTAPIDVIETWRRRHDQRQRLRMMVRGTIYVPTGDVKVNGSGGTLTMDQVIAWRFKVNGATGSIMRALNELDYVYLFRAAGLVE